MNLIFSYSRIAVDRCFRALVVASIRCGQFRRSCILGANGFAFLGGGELLRDGIQQKDGRQQQRQRGHREKEGNSSKDNYNYFGQRTFAEALDDRSKEEGEGINEGNPE